MEVTKALSKTLNIRETSPNDIVSILLQTTNFLSEKVEKPRQLKLKKLKSLQTLTLKVLHICHSKYHEAHQPSTRPSFWDALAALLSVYLDIVILMNRESPVCVKQLCGSIAFLLAEHPIHLLDVLLQTNCPSEETAELDSSLLTPLCRRWVSLQKSLSDPQDYTKFIATIRLRCSLYPTDLADVIEESSQVKAPKKYLQWIQEQDSSILDEIPVTPKLKLRRLTRFFLNEASNDVIENILDLTVASEANLEQDPVKCEEVNKNPETSEMNSEQVGGYMIDKSASVITDEILQDLNEENLPVEEDEMDSAAEDGEEDEERRGEEDEEEVPIESEIEENHDGESKEDVMKFTLSSLDKLIKDARRNSTGNPVVEEEVNEPEEKVDDREGMGAESAELMEVESNSPPSKISPKKSSSLSSVAGSSPMKVARKSISPVKNAIKSPVKSPMKDATLVELHSDEASKRTSPVKSPRKILTPKFDQAAKSTESPDKMKEEKGESFTAIKSPDSLPSSKKTEGKPSSERVPTPMRRSSRKRQSIIPDLAAVTEYEESSSGQENTNNSNGIFDLGSESEWSPKGMGSKARNMLQHIKSSKVTTPTKKRRVSLSEEVKDPQICECDSPKETKKGCDSSRRRSMPAAKMGALDSPAAAASPAKSRRQSMEPTRRSQRLRQK